MSAVCRSACSTCKRFANDGTRSARSSTSAEGDCSPPVKFVRLVVPAWKPSPGSLDTRSTLGRGLKQLDAEPFAHGRVRHRGGGRRSLVSRDATLLDDLRRVVEPATLGDPMRPLLWISKSHDKLAVAMQTMGHKISAVSVKRLLPTLGYSRPCTSHRRRWCAIAATTTQCRPPTASARCW